MADIKQAQAFMRVARRDLTALHGMFDEEVFADEIFGFHVQQAIEKCLKAWLCALGLSFPFSHDLNRLLVLLRDAGAEVDRFWWVDEYTVFAQQARYEDGYTDSDAPLHRINILKQVDDLFVAVEQAIAVIDSSDAA
jgi:HEPN domain-containing protein